MPPSPVSTVNTSGQRVSIGFSAPITTVGIDVATRFVLRRGAASVPVTSATAAGGVLRVDHTTDAGNVDRVHYIGPDPADVANTSLGTASGGLVGPFALPVPFPA